MNRTRPSAPASTRRRARLGSELKYGPSLTATGIVVGRNLLAPSRRSPQEASPPAQGVLDPNAGTWRAVGASADLPKGGALSFDLGSVNGFVHRVDTHVEAVSGICTHQGCKLVVHDLCQQLARRNSGKHILAQSLLPYIVGKSLGGFIIDVGIQKGFAYFLHGLGHVDLGDRPLSFQDLERPV